MPNPDFDLAVFVGRFQPFHDGHLTVVRAALERAETLLVVVGSADAARRPDLLPFTVDERREMILAALTPPERARVCVVGARDVGDAPLWAAQVRALAEHAAAELGLGPDARITLAGCSKDRSSYYLRAFPQWASVDVAPYGELSATPLRRAYFAADPQAVDAFLAGPAREAVPAAVADWLQAFRETDAYADLVEEQRFVDGYRAGWAAAPYPPTFVTADAVVVHGDRVLLIRRRNRPGRGLWALPGGFVETDEFVLDAAVRELAEETGLAVDPADLRRGLVATRVFDAPLRDGRGRVITHASLFHLPSSGSDASPPAAPPATRAADDAAEARWVALAALRSEEMYSDHFQVIAALTALIPGRA